MAQSKLDYYKESGIAPSFNLTLAVIFSLLTILLLSYIYSFIITYLPVIYFNFLVVVGYGFAISFVSRIFILIFKIRNRKKSMLFTIILAIFAIYFQWASYLFIISYETYDIGQVFKDFGYFFNILFRPDLVISEIIEISKIGLWSLGVSGINIRGFALWFVWLAEAGIILFISYNNFKNFDLIPFSEKDNNWFKKQIIDFDFEYIVFKKNFIDEFHLDPFKAISELKRGDGLRHSKISIYNSETESKSLITIDNIVVTQKGKGKKDRTKVLEYCYVDNTYLSQLKEKYKIKKASILD